MTPYLGISVHYLKAVDLIFVNGTKTHVDDTLNKDLMWALRGAGQNLGVATKFYFDFSQTFRVKWNLIMYNLSPLDKPTLTTLLQRTQDAFKNKKYYISSIHIGVVNWVPFGRIWALFPASGDLAKTVSEI